MIYKQLPDGCRITYHWQSPNWDESSFLQSGGIVAVVLNYNKRNFIEKACESAFYQEYGCYEILLMDDASIDGSDGVLENAAIRFVAHIESGAVEHRMLKITVVRNYLNQTTLGQWSLAVTISAGKWFVMFCGDDMSYGNRIKTLHDIMDMYPSAVGICTSGDASSGERLGKGEELLTWRGGEKLPLLYWLGCTSAWHRTILERSFGKHTMDDFILFWSAIILRQDVADVNLVWALNVSTIHYNFGSGVSTEDQKDAFLTKNYFLRLWRYARAWKKFEQKFGANTWKFIREFDAINGKDGYVRDWIRGYYFCAIMGTYGWWVRLKTMLSVLIVNGHDSFGGIRKYVVKTVIKRFIFQMFGSLSFAIGIFVEMVCLRIKRLFC